MALLAVNRLNQRGPYRRKNGGPFGIPHFTPASAPLIRWNGKERRSWPVNCCAVDDKRRSFSNYWGFYWIAQAKKLPAF
jgi:hypothetical protein